MSEEQLISKVMNTEGILLINKPAGKTSFSLVRTLRRVTGIQKIGHAGTLDPFATGVMVLLIGKQYTRLSDKLLCEDKEYIAELHLGTSTDTYDCDGSVVASSKKVPTVEQITDLISLYQGEREQIPPMYSAKKVKGKKLYEMARQGVTIERSPLIVQLKTTLLSYEYPLLRLQIACSKGTYIRSIAQEMGDELGCGAHLSNLQRIRSGQFRLEQCIDGKLLEQDGIDVESYLIQNPDLN